MLVERDKNVGIKTKNVIFLLVKETKMLGKETKNVGEGDKNVGEGDKKCWGRRQKMLG